MAQFDVHRNPGRTRGATPYLMVVQRDRYDDTTHRVAVPLVLASEMRKVDHRLNPAFMIDGHEVVMDPLQIVTVPAKALGAAIDNLDRHNIEILRSIDELVAYGR
jgi:toxin CcdB